MKISSINRNLPVSSGTTSVPKDPNKYRERTYAGMCDKKQNRGYNVKFSGNPSQVVSEVAAKSFGDKILSSKAFGSILDYAEDHPISCNALFSLVLAGICRPLTIMAIPDKDGKSKKDKLNAAAHAVASGVIGFISSTIIMSPFDSAMKKIKADPVKYLGKKAEAYLGDLKQQGLTKTPKFKNVEKLIKMGPDIVIGIPRSIITIALIPPILKYVFGIEPKAKQKVETKIQTEAKVQENVDSSKVFLTSSAFDTVKGGAK